jgi:PAS domain S-box-containing protein
MRNWPLRYRFLVTTLLVEVVLLCVLVWNAMRVTEHYLIDQTEHRVQELRPLLNASLARPLLEEDAAALAEIGGEFMRAQGVLAMTVYNVQRQRLMALGATSVTLDYDHVAPIAAYARSADALKLYPLRVPLEIDRRVIGYVDMALDVSFIARALDASYHQGLAIASTGVLLSAVVLGLLAVFLTRQLSVLRTAAQAMANGDLGARVPVYGHDEVGETATMFNHMAERIAHGQSALRESEARVRLLLDSTAEAIYGMDRSGMCTFANPACARTLGYSSVNDLIGRDLHTLVHHSRPDGSPFPSEECPVYQSFRQGRSLHADNDTFWRQDGSSFPVEYHCTPIQDQDGVTGAVVAFRDITERRKIDRMKNEFVSTVSHELRTPLTSIHGSLALVTGGVAGPLPTEAKAMLDIATRNSERLIGLVNDILSIEKIESGGLEFRFQIQALMPLVQQAMEANQSYAQQAGVRFVLTHGLPEAQVHVDAARLMQVFSNLMSNAAKFSPAGGQVELAVTAPRAGIVRVSVTDHGDGIPEDFQARLFQKFSQADASDTRNNVGTGLGLNIAKLLTEKMGGSIGYSTRAGAGTTFHVDLPRRDI